MIIRKGDKSIFWKILWISSFLTLYLNTLCFAFVLPTHRDGLSLPVYTDFLNYPRNISPNFILTAQPFGLDAPYGRYNYLKELTSPYLVLDNYQAKILKNMLDNGIRALGYAQIQQALSPYSLGMGDLRAKMIFLAKSPYYHFGEIKIPEEDWGRMNEDEKILTQKAIEALKKIPFLYQEIIRQFPNLSVEPDILPWPKFKDIESVRKMVQETNLLKEKIDYGDLREYQEVVERAVISAIAGFNYEKDLKSLLSGGFSSQAISEFHQRIEYWLKSEEFVPYDFNSLEEKEEEFLRIKEKALSLFNSLKLKPGLYPESPWEGEIAEIYRLFGGEIPTQRERGRLTPYADWGEDIYKKPPDISLLMEKVNSDFGILIKGPEMLPEQLKDKIKIIGPAIAGLDLKGGKKYIRILEIDSQGQKKIVVYQEAKGEKKTMNWEEFLSQWDKFVYIPEEKNPWAKVISDFSRNDKDFSLIKGYGQWTINEFDQLKVVLGGNQYIPPGVDNSHTYYFYTQYRVGGENTNQYVGYFQTGWWLSFQEEMKKNLLRG
ncbi:MAG: hypothetical protein ACK4NT_05615, partial [Candidatus Omnitrophota bacterium]